MWFRQQAGIAQEMGTKESFIFFNIPSFPKNNSQRETILHTKLYKKNLHLQVIEFSDFV